MPHKRAIKKTKTGNAVLPIAMVFGFDRRNCCGVLRGIGRYARGCDNWALIEVFPHNRLAEALGTLKPAGIIVHDTCEGIADILRKTKRPVVNVSGDLDVPHFPRITLDEASAGAMAANHLLECGLRNFGYFGPPWGGPTADREGGFYQTLRNLSYTVLTCYVRPSGDNPVGGTFESQKHVFRWLDQLPKPSGIFAPTDTWALWLCGICKQEGIKVPEEVAIIGTENDELVCELSQPTLSSIVFPSERVGYEAAAMLDRLIHKEPLPTKPLFLPAAGVVTRQSTDVLAVADPDLVTAINYMRNHISEPIAIKDVLQHTVMSRRSFEQKFHEALGRSPAQEICRMRVTMAKTLLTSTRMKTKSIARRCGFAPRARFFLIFRKATGMTPAEYRRAMGQESDRGTSSAGSSARRF